MKKEKKIKNLPLLLIDDEADNASINISKYYVSGINGYIRGMLHLFDNSAYIGYTATPYANLFIKNETSEDIKDIRIPIGKETLKISTDLFPENFIINLPAPSNYIGPERLFGIKRLEEADPENIENEELVLSNLYEEIEEEDYKYLIPDSHKKMILNQVNYPRVYNRLLNISFWYVQQEEPEGRKMPITPC